MKIKTFAIAAMLILGGSFIIYLYYYRNTISTDNAYIRGNITNIAPKISGNIEHIYIKDNQPVKKGERLLRIDQRDYIEKVKQAQSSLAVQEATLLTIEANKHQQTTLIAQAQANVNAAVATWKNAQRLYHRYTSLKETGAVSRQQYDEATTTLEENEAKVAAAKAYLSSQQQQLQVLEAEKKSAQASLRHAQDLLEQSQLELSYTEVYSPVDGVVGNRQARVGLYVAAGTTLMSIVPLSDLWIVANFKENEIDRLHINQQARITLDSFPDVTLIGNIDSFSPGSGASFSVIPADNATGNFVRVVQRVPVKITLSKLKLDADSSLRLVPGLSAVVEIDTVSN
ncbi:HlyD family secretion protein [Brenneria tiliae]|uniref:HlyD family secretion protein n=1 Tax=Brenneria tiliae TaxID=2914984 RepID=A0ABT0MYW1_9GAMM|nr:HlyD family secretion protein [Brenneria tiliae]MCL2895050.1 HlyD family secretion protein [Brenneria tiliae]